MKTPDYQLKLRELAPSVVFDVAWSHDEDARWPKDCGERGDYIPYNTEVTARAIVGGEEVEGRACMGGTWEIPGKMDPEIGGYLPQMLEEAASELITQKGIPLKIKIELRAVIGFLKTLMRQRWQEQQSSRETERE